MTHGSTRHATPALKRALAAGRRFGRTMARRVTGPGYVNAPLDDDACRSQYQRDGFVSGGMLVDAPRLAQLRREFERVFADRERPGSGVECERVEDGDGREYFKLYNLRDHSEAFHDLVTDERLAAMLENITGCRRFRVLLEQIQYKPPGCGGANGWHRDMPSFPLIAPYTALTAWIPLDDVTEENGAMAMVPGSHLWGDASDIAVNHWGLDLSSCSKRYRGHRVRRVSRPLRAGSVHFHHELTWHCSPPNRTEGQRRALAIHYFNADARYCAGGPTVYAGVAHGDLLDSVKPLVIGR
jgi:ectoine hydroxylase-related dioxygenase (phytanoyl-CoA dioxygenase family)